LGVLTHMPELEELIPQQLRKVSGVRAVLTRDDVIGRFNPYGATMMDQTIVALDKVRYVGDPVAAVAAVDLSAAEMALSLITVEYEELEAVFTIEEAISPALFYCTTYFRFSTVQRPD